MSVKSGPPPARMKAAWIGAGVLCALVLALLWITAHQIKERKMRARYGEKVEPAGPPPLRLTLSTDASPKDLLSAVEAGREVHLEIPPRLDPKQQAEALESARRRDLRLRFLIGAAGRTTLTLPRDASVDVEHFTLRYGPDESVSVHDSRGRHAVDFTGLKAKETRRWQELEIGVDEVREEGATVTLALRPGSPCLGAGRYHYLHPGLTIEVAPETRVQIRTADPSGPEIRLTVTEGAETRNASVARDETLRIGAASLRLERTGRSIALVVN